jgi:hypothetical protein
LVLYQGRDRLNGYGVINRFCSVSEKINAYDFRALIQGPPTIAWREDGRVSEDSPLSGALVAKNDLVNNPIGDGQPLALRIAYSKDFIRDFYVVGIPQLDGRESVAGTELEQGEIVGGVNGGDPYDVVTCPPSKNAWPSSARLIT